MGFPQFDFGGECGVSLFFVLSGFVLSLRYSGEVREGSFQHKQFFLHQLSKFYPLHLALLALILILNYRNLDLAWLLKFAPQVVLLQSWIPNVEYYFAGNAVSWFLSDIVFFYALFPYLCKALWGRRSCVILGMLIVLIIYAIYLALVPPARYNDLLYAPPYVRVIDFALGILGHRLYCFLLSRIQSQRCAVLLELLAVLVFANSYLVYPEVCNRVHCAALFFPVSLICVVAFAVSDRFNTPLTRLLHSRVLTFCGTLTFEIFLLHPQINWSVYVMLCKIGFPPNRWALFLCCFASILLISYLVKRYFTAPVARRISERLVRQ